MSLSSWSDKIEGVGFLRKTFERVPIRHGRGRSKRGLVKEMGEVAQFW